MMVLLFMWHSFSFRVETMIAPRLKNFLYNNGPKFYIPQCLVDNGAWYPSRVVFQAYFIDNKDCSFKALQILPFFIENFGPK